MTFTEPFTAKVFRSLCVMAVLAHPCASALAVTDRVLVVAGRGKPLVRKVVDAFQRRSTDATGVSGKETLVDVRFLEPGQPAADLAKLLKPQLPEYQVVLATSIVIARAIQNENAQVPIVFVGEADPVQFCLADSMQRPGRNVTGYMDYLPDDDVKMMEALVDGFPYLRTIYLMVADTSYYVPDCGPARRDAKPAAPPCVPGPRPFDPTLAWWQQTPAVLPQAQRLGVQVKFMMLCKPADFALLSRIEPQRKDIGFVFALQNMYGRHDRALLAQVALSRRPTIFGRSRFAQRGGLMSLEPILDADDDQAVINMLRQVLDGRTTATLPIQVPRGFRLTVNAAAAAEQGLRPSLKLLRRADEVILGAGR